MGNVLGMVVLTYKGKGGMQEDHTFEASYILRPCLRNTEEERGGWSWVKTHPSCNSVDSALFGVF